MSKPLHQIQREDANSEDIWMTSMYDKYKARPHTPEFNGMCQAVFVSSFRYISKTEGKKKHDAHNPNVAALDDGKMGYMIRRTTGRSVIRFAKFSPTKDPEKYFKSLLKLYLPHRSDVDLKPADFETHEDFYENGKTRSSKSVNKVVDENRSMFEANSAAQLDDAMEQLNTVGPLEDAWAQIAPQTKQERLEAEEEIVEDDDALPPEEIPDITDGAHPQPDRLPSSLCSHELMGQSIRPLFRTMNKKQRDVFYLVRKWCLQSAQGHSPEPFFLHVNGGAGVGKSHLIKCIYNEASKLLRNGENPSDTTVLLTAPTGTAAFNVGGFTLHSALKIPVNAPQYYENLRNETLNTLRSQLDNLKILIIDEISMVDRKVFSYVDGRLRQIKQINSTTLEPWFGKVSILAVGDFYQLRPVKSKPLLIPDNGTGFDLWHGLFEIVTLDEVMRQKDDAALANLLNRLRVKPKSQEVTAEDDAVLKAREGLDNVPETALHVFATNKMVDHHNNTILEQVCGDNLTNILAEDSFRDPTSGRVRKREIPNVGDAGTDLPDVIRLGISARVMLTKNINVGDGLVNGTFGKVVHIDLDRLNDSFILVKFDSPKVGQQLLGRSVGTSGAVKIVRYEGPLSNKKGHKRRQFPLKLAWACTIHKTQGMTTDQCVFDMKGVFSSGQSYVALSRVTTLQGLFLTNYNPKAIWCDNEVGKHLAEMRQFTTDIFIPDVHQQHPPLTVSFHNVCGLKSKMHDIKANTDVQCDVIIVAETWLKESDDTETVDIDGYEMYRKDRADNSGFGGVAIYVSDDVYAVHESLLRSFDVTGIEYLAWFIKKRNDLLVLIVAIYRSPKQSKKAFKDILTRALQLLEEDIYAISEIIVVGDFNENLMTPDNPFHEIFTQPPFSYNQLVCEPTTRSGSLLDAAYVKGIGVSFACKVLQTYYSDHEALLITVNNTEDEGSD